jgi:hypothetical protein
MRAGVSLTGLDGLAGILGVDRFVAAEEVRLTETSLHRLHEGT